MLDMIKTSLGHDINGKHLVALSGGIDSMVLLHAMKKLHANAHACHVNHKIHHQADEHEAFCQKSCESLDIPFTSVAVDLSNVPQEHSLESLARDKRYRALDSVAKEQRCTAILTAHHQQDNAETILINMLRGTGLDGLSGIPERRGNIIRPLLKATKAEILKWGKDHQVMHIEDPTNISTDFLRNRIRHELIPMLETMGQGDPVHSINKLGNIARQEKLGAKELAKRFIHAQGENISIQPPPDATDEELALIFREASAMLSGQMPSYNQAKELIKLFRAKSGEQKILGIYFKRNADKILCYR